MSNSLRVYAVATLDTKGAELQFVADELRRAGVSVVTVDVGSGGGDAGSGGPAGVAADVPRERVAAFGAESDRAVLHAAISGQTQDRGTAVAAMSRAFEAFLRTEAAAGRVGGVIGLGGSGGTSLISPALQSLPVGVPKLIVSTVASGNVAPYVGGCDITLMYSVVDIAGLNTVSKRILRNAAAAMAGMVLQTRVEEAASRPTIGLTMFGVTTPCVTAIRQQLEAAGFDPLVFHATGAGGRAMEKLVESGLITGVLDVTTTEVADEVVGGVFPSGPKRFEAILKAGVPYVLSLGALDMVNFGPRDTVPPQFASRKLHVHNATVTLMRTTPEENREIAAWIAGKLNASTTPVTVLVPEQGVSALDSPGQPFYDPDANAALFQELSARLQSSPQRRIVSHPLHVNDRAFAAAVTDEFLRLWSSRSVPPR
jgi:uncharacterized protein (UPF0261 family)